MHENNNDTNAISIYGHEGLDDFPVLKAFQQYIDAEQAKARKRLVAMGVFFGILMGAVIAVFVAMLFVMSQRNQQLNDRLVEFAMRDRDRQSAAPVVVQPAPAPQPAPSKPKVIGPHLEYEVVAGDNLSIIAHAFGTTVEKIKEMNSLKNNNLRIGQKLMVPKK